MVIIRTLFGRTFGQVPRNRLGTWLVALLLLEATAADRKAKLVEAIVIRL
jgi:hypothetical protein